MFARRFRHHGMGGLRPYLTVYKVNDFVDIKVRSFNIAATPPPKPEINIWPFANPVYRSPLPFLAKQGTGAIQRGMPHKTHHGKTGRFFFKPPFQQQRFNGDLGLNVPTLLCIINPFSSGKIFTVSPRGVGVTVTKRIRNRYLAKRIYVRVEHIKPSNCRKEFLLSVSRLDPPTLALTENLV